MTAPHGRGESHATVLCGAYLTRGGIGVEEAEELVVYDSGNGLSQKVSNHHTPGQVAYLNDQTCYKIA